MFASMPFYQDQFKDVDEVSTISTRTQKVQNKKGAQRRFTHRMTLGDSKSEIFTCRYDPSDKYIACGFGDGAVRIYNTSSGKCSYTLCSQVD